MTTPTIEPGWDIIEPKDHTRFSPKQIGDEYFHEGKWKLAKEGVEFFSAFTYRRRKPAVEQSGFWLVMRLGSNGVQQIDSLPHKHHATKADAINEAQRLADKYPNGRFVVLESVQIVRPSKSADELAFEKMFENEFPKGRSFPKGVNLENPKWFMSYFKNFYFTGLNQGKKSE